MASKARHPPGVLDKHDCSFNWQAHITCLGLTHVRAAIDWALWDPGTRSSDVHAYSSRRILQSFQSSLPTLRSLRLIADMRVLSPPCRAMATRTPYYLTPISFSSRRPCCRRRVLPSALPRTAGCRPRTTDAAELMARIVADVLTDRLNCAGFDFLQRGAGAGLGRPSASGWARRHHRAARPSQPPSRRAGCLTGLAEKGATCRSDSGSAPSDPARAGCQSLPPSPCDIDARLAVSGRHVESCVHRVRYGSAR